MPDGAGIPVVLPGQLDERQRQAFDIVKEHHDADDVGTLRMLVLGTAGTKSWLVYALSNLLGDRSSSAGAPFTSSCALPCTAGNICRATA